MAEENLIAVGLGELKIGRDSHDILVAYGLGSCIGVAAYDPVRKIGAMAHVMLPEPNDARVQARSAKFATQAVPMVLEALTSQGCLSSRLIWRIAGGAQVLSVPGLNGKLMVGERNIATIKKVFEHHRITVAGEDTGGKFGRTMQLHIQSGKVTIRSVGGPQREL